jgi:hypothetical protein
LVGSICAEPLSSIFLPVESAKVDNYYTNECLFSNVQSSDSLPHYFSSLEAINMNGPWLFTWRLEIEKLV